MTLPAIDDWCDPADHDPTVVQQVMDDPALADQLAHTLRLESLLRDEWRARTAPAAPVVRRPPHRRHRRTAPRRLIPVLAAAAVIAVGLGLWWQHDVQTVAPPVPVVATIAVDDPAGRTLTWDDGSRVQLHSGARARLALIHDQPASNATLQVLAGSLTATIAPHPAATPFRIHTDTSAIEVLGTAFTVTASDHRTDLAVTHGRVRLTLASSAQSHDPDQIQVSAGGFAMADATGNLVAMPLAGRLLWRLDIPQPSTMSDAANERDPFGAPALRDLAPTDPTQTVCQIRAQGAPLFRWDERAEIRFSYCYDGPRSWVGIWVQGPDQNGPNYFYALPTPPAGQWRSAAVPLAAIPTRDGRTAPRPIPGSPVRQLAIQAGALPGSSLRVAHLRIEVPIP